MHPDMENPALAARGVPVAVDLAGCSIEPELKSPLRNMQAHRLTRRYAISLSMATIVAPFIHGEAVAMTRERLPNRRANETQEFERDGVHMTLTVGHKPSDDIGEIFLNCRPANSMLDVLLSDAAIIASLALQHGVPVRQLAHAIKRDQFGTAASPIGAALDRICPPEVL